jgi:hypothetical protein
VVPLCGSTVQPGRRVAAAACSLPIPTSCSPLQPPTVEAPGVVEYLEELGPEQVAILGDLWRARTPAPPTWRRSATPHPSAKVAKAAFKLRSAADHG